MVDIWVSNFNRAGSNVMLYTNTLLYIDSTVPKRHIAKLSKNILQYAELANAPGSHIDNLCTVLTLDLQTLRVTTLDTMLSFSA